MNFLATENTPESANENIHKIWVEKYRPRNLSEYIGNELLKNKVAQYIKENDVPHLLLCSPSPGTGKTSLAKLIANSIKCDLMYINASEENGIDTVRAKIKDFASTLGFNPLKIIILDEFCGFSQNAQAALKNMIEEYSAHTRFIFTCNYREKIIAPIISRCQIYDVNPPSKKEVAANLINILNKEKIKFDKDGIVLLVNTHYPDIRAIINTAQRNVINNELVLAKEDVLVGDIKSKVVESLRGNDKKQAFMSIRQLIADHNIKNFSDFYTLLYEEVENYSDDNVAQCIVIIADGQFQDSGVVDKEICFMSTIIKLLKLNK